MSSFFYSSSRDHYNKLLKFIILLSQSKLESADLMLQDFSHQNYFNHLERLIKHLLNYQVSKKEAILSKYTISELTRKIQAMNNQPQQLTIRQSKTNESEIIRIFNCLEAQSFEKAKTIAEVHKQDKLCKIIEELIEYRDLKKAISANKLRGQNQVWEGRSLIRVIEDYVKMRQQTNRHLTLRINNCLLGRPVDILPQHLFLQDFRQKFQQLTKTFKAMKDEEYSFKQELKQKFITFTKEHSIDWKYRNDQNFLDNVFSCIKSLQQRPKIRRCNTSTIILPLNQNESFIDPLKTVVRFERKSEAPSKRSVKHNQLISSQSIERLNIDQKVGCIYSTLFQPCSNKQWEKLPVCSKLQKILVKVKDLVSRQQNFDNISHMLSFINEAEQPMVFRNISEEIMIDDAEERARKIAIIQRLQQSVGALQKKNAELIKLNENYIAKIKQFENESNISFIEQQPTGMEAEKEGLIREINRLNSELQQKCSTFKVWEEEKKAMKKQLQAEKVNFTKLQKKLHGLQEEYEHYFQQVQFLNNICEEQRLMIESFQNNQKIDEDTMAKINKEKTLLQQEKTALAQQNLRIKQEIKKTTNTQEIAIGSSLGFSDMDRQDEQENNQEYKPNGSFLSSMKEYPSKTYFDAKVYQDRISDLEHNLSILAAKYKQKEEQVEAFNRRCEDLKHSLEEVEKERESLHHKLDIIDIRNITHNPQNVNNVHLFPPGFIFGQHDYLQRQFLLQNLISYVGPIRSTRLLYRADPFNKTNFHNYIDKNQHVVLICKTIYGKMIAGYSSQAFDPKGIQKGRGMILSLWSRKAFYVKDKKAISYDDYYIIYGNSELRVRSLQFKLFSNFGIANAYYENNGARVDIILGQGSEREVDLLEYEVYALDLWQ